MKILKIVLITFIILSSVNGDEILNNLQNHMSMLSVLRK